MSDAYALPEGHPLWVDGEQVNASGSGVSQVVVDGWFDAPEVRDVRRTNTARDGETARQRYLAGRTLEIRGIVSGDDYADLQANKQALSGVFAPLMRREGLVKLPLPDEANPDTTYADELEDYERVTATILEGVAYGERVGLWAQSWQVVMRASDPRVFVDKAESEDSAETGSSPRTVAASPAGSYETPTTITVTGPTGNDFVVSEPDSGLYLPMVGLPIESGKPIVFDTAQRTIDYTATYVGARLISQRLKAIWMLDETAGSTADNAEGTAAYDATYTGGFTLDQTGPRTGIKSVALNGTTGYVTTSVNAGFLPTLTTQTFECWVKFDSVTSGTHTIVDCINSNRGWRLQMVGAAGGASFKLVTGYGSGTNIKTQYTALAAGTWYHLVLNIDAATGALQLLVDGVLRLAPRMGNTPLNPTSGSFRLGATVAGADFLDGNLAAAAVYATELSPAERASLYAMDATASTVSAYSYLDPGTARWALLQPSNATFTLNGSALTNDSKLTVEWRDARI